MAIAENRLLSFFITFTPTYIYLLAMKTAISLFTFSLRALLIVMALWFVPFLGYAQNDVQFESEEDSTDTVEMPSAYFGFSPGVGLFTRAASGGVPGNTFHNANFNGGLTLLVGDIEDFTFKTGLEFNFFRSPYLSDTSYYEEFITIPFLFQVESSFRKGDNKYFTIHIGPAVSLPTRNGYAGALDTHYNTDDFGFLDYAKISGLAEFTLYSKHNSGFNAFGLRLSADIGTGQARPGRELEPQRYLMATLFGSFLFGK